DEVLPELAWLFLPLRLRPEPHQGFLEPFRLERSGKGLLDDEHDPMTPPEEDVSDPDAVVRGAVRALGEEHDRRHRRTLAWGNALFPHAGRRGRDLNPRRTFRPVRDFQSRSLDRSDTSPSGLSVSRGLRDGQLDVHPALLLA